MSFLDGILGIKQIVVNGVALPSRGTLTFNGAVTGVDDPANNQTIITVTATTAVRAKAPTEEGERHG